MAHMKGNNTRATFDDLLDSILSKVLAHLNPWDLMAFAAIQPRVRPEVEAEIRKRLLKTTGVLSLTF